MSALDRAVAELAARRAKDDADRRARILGGHVARRLRRRRTRDAKGSLVLAGLVDRRLPLRAQWKTRKLRATLRLPPRSRLFALGVRHVYLLAVDADGFQTLERYNYPDFR